MIYDIEVTFKKRIGVFANSDEEAIRMVTYELSDKDYGENVKIEIVGKTRE